MAGIVSYGAYIPYNRLARSVIAKAWGGGGGRGEIAVANYDEDPTTMSVAAGMDCLKGFDPRLVDAMYMATTNAPFVERLNSAIAATALDMRRDIRTADFNNGLRAGTTALLAGLDAIKAGSAKGVVVTASDMRQGAPSGESEMNFGNGAAAFLLGNENVIAEVEGSMTISEDMADYWRSAKDDFVKNWEDRFGRDEGYSRMPVELVKSLMAKMKLTPKDFTKICLYGANSRAHGELAKSLGFAPEQVQDSLLDTVGNTGVALSLMILVSALESAKAGDRILLVSWGSGVEAVVFKVTDKISALAPRRGIKQHINIKKNLDNYEKLLRWRSIVPLAPQARPDPLVVSMSSLWREHHSALPLYGVVCKVCGTKQLFADTHSTRARICVECTAKDQFEPYRFADKMATVASFSHDFLGLSQDPPNTLTVVDFEGGGRGAFEMTDRDPAECKVGMKIEMTFRRIASDRGVHNYFWKCKPARG